MARKILGERYRWLKAWVIIAFVIGFLLSLALNTEPTCVAWQQNAAGELVCIEEERLFPNPYYMGWGISTAVVLPLALIYKIYDNIQNNGADSNNE